MASESVLPSINDASGAAGSSLAQSYEIPEECWAGCVHNIGPEFELKVERVLVPKPGMRSGFPSPTDWQC